MELRELGQRAVEAKPKLAKLSIQQKNEGLECIAQALISSQQEILNANDLDIQKAKKEQMPEGLVDRLLLTPQRVVQMADGLRQLIGLKDPIGRVVSMEPRPNGLLIGKKIVPLGVVGIIYESRPNVTADAFGLCFKTNNAVILKGGKEALESNKAIVSCIRRALEKANITPDAIQLIEDTSRETTISFMKMREYVDVLIPRGGAGLIQSVVQNSTIPVIETGTGNCHIYVDETADLTMAVDIVFNAKTQRIGVCNACESLVVHRDIEKKFLPMLKKKLDEKQVELRGDEEVCKILPDATLATPQDWGCEYLDYILSIKTVGSIEEAITHINRYNTKHSESIITSSYDHAQRFLEEIDASVVYVNASTRFTDGGEFGFGAEVGISTQKLHARGPMGLDALTTTKYIIYGSGQVR